MKYAKRIRLKDFSYRGCYRYFITIRCSDNHNYFVNDSVVKGVCRLLEDTAVEQRFQIWAYCFMPDHLHLLVEGLSEDADMRKFVSLFKQRTGYKFRRNHQESLWHKNYYEHILRGDEQTKKVAEYISENPIRKGIVEEHDQYPHAVSFI